MISSADGWTSGGGGSFNPATQRGYQWMIITSWAYVFLWLGYLVNMLANFPDRFGASVFGVTGWWVFDIWYMTPFVILPWLYALDRRRWCRA